MKAKDDAEAALLEATLLEATLANANRITEIPADTGPIIEVPPKYESRLFNENDILGEIERDEDGLFTLLPQNAGPDKLKDKNGHPINPKGYLTHPMYGDILDNHHGKIAFKKSTVDP